MNELIDLTLTLGSDRISLVPGLVGVETEPIQTHETHARSNQKLCLATHIGTHVDAPYHFVDGATTGWKTCPWRGTRGLPCYWTYAPWPKG